MSSVRTFSVKMNDLTGTFPDALSALSRLQYLGLGVNRLSGTIPNFITQLTALR